MYILTRNEEIWQNWNEIEWGKREKKPKFRQPKMITLDLNSERRELGVQYRHKYRTTQ